MYKTFAFFLFLIPTAALAQRSDTLSVEKIMQDPKWMGVSPDRPQWSENSKTLFFTWNPELKERAETYEIQLGRHEPAKTTLATANSLLRSEMVYKTDRSVAVYEQNGDLFLYHPKNQSHRQLSNTIERETNPRFTLQDNQIVFERDDNLYLLDLANNQWTQLTNFSRNKKNQDSPLSAQDQWLKDDQLRVFETIQGKKKNQELDKERNETRSIKRPKEIFLAAKDRISQLQISPDLHYVTYRITNAPEDNQNTLIPEFVTESGYTNNINGRTKVGNRLATSRFYIYDRRLDSISEVNSASLPGIKDLPDYLNDYPERLEEAKKANIDRKVNIFGPYWSPASERAVVTAYSSDNKDRWILELGLDDKSLRLVDRQRDEAWIGGPGISPYSNAIGWINNHQLYFQSEESGYSHLYVYDFQTGNRRQLTSGKYEIQSLILSNDRKHFYFSANIDHPGITHFYKISVSGGEPTQLTNMKGGNEVSLSPDEKWLAIRHSTSNRPWELYLQENKAGAKAVQITKSTSQAFDAYAWREPDVVSFKNRHGDDVYARVYKPTIAHPSKPAVIFVHGAGYLQNVHHWWSQYFREYMFNNFLADQGYTVIDIDYTASSGYGRNHRTGIYRHMGGKDLSDHVDGVAFLEKNYGINPSNVGIYGGSYGGFITLMGLFTEPEVFKSGAALRSVTDWAHYNHGYTSNILNEPFNDEIAYKRSSPLYFAEGLKGHLLMAHGMVDVNVHFQDIVRLSQRLIELGKDNWELAVYPVEDHAFVEPASWTDEYKRIYKLFEKTLKQPPINHE